MISITKLFEDPSEASQDNVDEGAVGDFMGNVGHTLRQRTMFRKKPVPTGVLAQRRNIKNAAAVINNR